MIRLIKISTREEFDIPDEFKLELNINNPLLTDIGEQTLPGTLPPTSKNLRMLEHPNRTDSRYKPITDLEVQLVDRSYIKECKMVINPSDYDSGISFTLYLDTGALYSKIDEIMIDQLDWEIINESGFSGNFQTQVLNPILASVNGGDNRFVCVPLLTSQNYTIRYSGANFAGLLTLNGLERYKNAMLDQQQYSMESWAWINNHIEFLSMFYSHRLEGEYTQQHVENGAYIDVGRGYGVSPFLRLKYMLERMFQLIGYKFSYDDITSYDSNLAKIILLNNTADAIYARKLKFSHLVPKLSVKEFFAELEKNFVGKFLTDESTKKCNFYYWKDVLNAEPDLDLTPYIVNVKPQLGSGDFKKLVLNINNSYQKEENSKDKEEVIVLETLTKKEIENDFGFRYSVFNPNNPQQQTTFLWRKNFRLKFHDIGSIIHKNSQVVVNNSENEPKIEKPEALTKVMLLSYNHNKTFRVDCQDETLNALKPYGMSDADWEQEKIDKNINWQYKSTDRIFEGVKNSETDEEVWQDLHKELADFLEFSNIPIKAQLRLPRHILANIKQYVPKLIDGQKVLIESIKTILGEDNPIQEVTFRTIRKFKNR